MYEMPRYGWNGQCGCYCGGPSWAYPSSRDEVVEEMEGYKASLESEIAALEKRIKALKEKVE